MVTDWQMAKTLSASPLVIEKEFFARGAPPRKGACG